MNWQRFVNKGLGARSFYQKSHHSLLLETVKGMTETNTLANWVRETNNMLESEHQMTLQSFM